MIIQDEATLSYSKVVVRSLTLKIDRDGGMSWAVNEPLVRHNFFQLVGHRTYHRVMYAAKQHIRRKWFPRRGKGRFGR